LPLGDLLHFRILRARYIVSSQSIPKPIERLAGCELSVGFPSEFWPRKRAEIPLCRVHAIPTAAILWAFVLLPRFQNNNCLRPHALLSSLQVWLTWICLARAGRNGSDGRSPNVCGTYDAREKYERLDIVALDGAAFIARCDNPGVCPGDGLQALSRQGRPGRHGETGDRGVRGEKGERGEPGATVVSWQLDREGYRISPLMSDGKVGPMLELRRLFERYHEEANS
jgi:hypothetical protein